MDQRSAQHEGLATTSRVRIVKTQMPHTYSAAEPLSEKILIPQRRSKTSVAESLPPPRNEKQWVASCRRIVHCLPAHRAHMAIQQPHRRTTPLLLACIHKAVQQALAAIGSASLTCVKANSSSVQVTHATGHTWSARALEKAEAAHKEEGLRIQQARKTQEAQTATEAAKAA